MNKTIRILGIDPAMSNTGLAVADYDVVTGELQVVKTMLAETAKSENYNVVRKSSDDLARARIMAKAIDTMIFVYKPTFLVAEVPGGCQSARGAFSNGMCVGVLASLTLPLLEVSPNEVKLAAVGDKNATKAQMIEWAIARWPDAGWLTYKRLGKVEINAKNEHIADACGAIAAGLLTPQFSQAVSMLTAMQRA